MKLRQEYLTNALFLLRILVKTLLNLRKSRKKALITLTGIEIKRPSLLLAKLLRLADYDVFLAVDFLFTIKMGVYGRQLFDDPRIFIHLPFGFIYDYSISNSERNLSLAREGIILDFNVFQIDRVTKKDLFFPIMFHPSFLDGQAIAHAEAQYLKRLDILQPDIGIFFAGAFSRENYDKEDTKTVFKILTRYEIINSIRSEFSSSFLYEPTDYATLLRDADAGLLRNKIVICDSSLVKIPEQDWFSILARSAYFLSPPGVLQPFCHNTVESMSVGTIPILQYPERYLPSLLHGMNCLRFNDRMTLIALVGDILNGVDFHRIKMSKAAHDYYRENLSSDAFTRKMNESDETTRATVPDAQPRRVFICQNQLSVALFRKESRQS